MNNWYLLAAIPVFGILVLVHEFGHFITAKWAGIRVEEFGLGFPPRIVGIRQRDRGGWEVVWFGGPKEEETYYGGQQTPFGGTSGGFTNFNVPASNHTLYSLNLLPIGGFVRMPGENGDMTNEQGYYDPHSFAAKPAGKRIIVLCAGVIMNVILAMVLFTIAYGGGYRLINDVSNGEQHHRQNHVHDDARAENDDTLARRFSCKAVRVVIALLICHVSIFAGHTHKAANGQEIQRIERMIRGGRVKVRETAAGAPKGRLLTPVGGLFLFRPAKPDDFPPTTITLTNAHNTRRKTQPELLDANASPLRGNKMTKLMHQHQDSKDRNGCQQVPVIHR